jgi:hypothetical protein
LILFLLENSAALLVKGCRGKYTLSDLSVALARKLFSQEGKEIPDFADGPLDGKDFRQAKLD